MEKIQQLISNLKNKKDIIIRSLSLNDNEILKQEIKLINLALYKIEKLFDNYFNNLNIKTENIYLLIIQELYHDYTSSKDRLLQMVENHEIIDDKVIEDYDINIILQDIINKAE